jgi:hypothetical protein
MFIFRPILSSRLMAVCRQNEWGKLDLPDSTQETHKIPNMNNKTESAKGKASKKKRAR